MRALGIAGTARGQAFVEETLREFERCFAAFRNRLRPAPQVREHGGRILAMPRERLGVRERRHLAKIPDRSAARLAFPERAPLLEPACIRAERGDIEGKRPALVLRELLERGHRRAGYAEADGAVQAVDAALAHARGVVKIGRRRIHVPRGRAVAAVLWTVTGRAEGRIALRPELEQPGDGAF